MLLIVSGLLVGVLPLFKDILEDKPFKWDDINAERGKRLTKMGRWFVFVLSIACASACAKYAIDSYSQKVQNKKNDESKDRETQLLLAHQRDSLAQVQRDANCKKDAELSAANYKLALARAQDSITRNLKKAETNINENIARSTKETKAMLDSSKTELNPLLDVHTIFLKDTVINNPWITWNATEKRGLFNIIITNESTAYAYNVRVNYTFLWLARHDDVEQMEYYDFFNGDCRFTKSEPVTQTFPCYQMIKLQDEQSNLMRTVDNLKYIAFEISYENAKGKRQKLIHKIYPVNTNKTNTLIPKVSDFEVDHITSELIRFNYWHTH